MAMPSASQWVHNEPAISWPAHAREGGLHDKRHDLRAGNMATAIDAVVRRARRS
jgi:hypothetical protein